jgi:3-methyladenine DNA glycosylase AlkD
MKTEKIPEYIVPLKELYESYADPEVAEYMKKYMKDRSDFFGIKSPLRRELTKIHYQRYGLIPDDRKEEIVKWCWQAPQREYQYFAMEALGKNIKKANTGIIELFEFMIVNKSWWDTVDYIASSLVGNHFLIYPDLINEFTSKWMASENMWLQRVCILFQLKYKTKTDTDLLTGFILKLKDSKEFFIRKAIGWALREYSKTDPEFVKKFVTTHKLTGLSEREALKWMRNKNI